MSCSWPCCPVLFEAASFMSSSCCKYSAQSSGLLSYCSGGIGFGVGVGGGGLPLLLDALLRADRLGVSGDLLLRDPRIGEPGLR